MMFANFAEKHGLRLTSHLTNGRIGWSGDPNANHYICTLHFNGNRTLFYFTMGSGLRGTPKLLDVLSCLMDDARGVVENPDFPDFHEYFGYGENVRESYRAWKACKHQAEKLRKFFGQITFDEFLTCVEEDYEEATDAL